MNSSMGPNQTGDDWSLACHLGNPDKGSLAIITNTNGQFRVEILATEAANTDPNQPKSVYLGINKDHKTVIMDPVSKELSLNDKFPVDAYAPYAYGDPDAPYHWYTNDGDNATGNDTLNCGDKGASVTVVRVNQSSNTPAEMLKTLCVGRGHHVTTFIRPSSEFPGNPHRAFVSNLRDGTISIIDYNTDEPETFLTILDIINLCEPQKEDSGKDCIPNNAFPHGMVYSPISNKIYNLNNGYGTIAVIDPVSHKIETRIDLPGCSNLLLSPNGKYIIGKGADRKADEDHVIGKLVIIDAVSLKVMDSINIPDFYPSTYRFNPEGSKLYVTSAATGKGRQKENLNINTLMIYDTSALPEMPLLQTLKTGTADCGRRPIAFMQQDNKARYVFVPNPTDATLTILDGNNDSVIETISFEGQTSSDFNFSFWGSGFYGS